MLLQVESQTLETSQELAQKIISQSQMDRRKRARILHLKFEDPQSRNSFSLRAARELGEVLDELESSRENLEPVVGLTFRAKGRVFCSGGNLSDYAALVNREQGHEINREIAGVLSRLSRIGIPTVCCVEGDCFGGGLELISAFDWVVSEPGNVFGFWQRRIGLSFGWGGGQRLARRMGSNRLIQCAMSAREIFTPEAKSIQLIDQISYNSRAWSLAKEKLDQLVRLSSAPLLGLKSLPAETLIENETAVFERLWWNPDHVAALNRFK